MIQISSSDNAPFRIDQWCTSPTAYLDHWAIRELSESKALSVRLVEAVQARGGTVALSWLNLVEFSRVSNEAQVRAAGALFHALFPNLFFIEINPFVVIENEDKLLSGADPFPPHADSDLLREFFLLEQKTPCPYDAVQLFEVAQESDRSGKFCRLKDTVVKRIIAVRDSLDQDQDLGRTLRKPAKASTTQAGTRDIVREIVRLILLDRRAPIRRNDAIDLMHTVVPVSYCDVVLLDRHWCTRVEQVRRRLEAVDAPFPISAAFSGRGRGLEDFLAKVESHQ
jgi:hypothetical protein